MRVGASAIFKSAFYYVILHAKHARDLLLRNVSHAPLVTGTQMEPAILIVQMALILTISRLFAKLVMGLARPAVARQIIVPHVKVIIFPREHV